ncbi:MAG TPA: molybdopterin cofactor-binding domain-containing protein, partial [Albitalea sp.]|nr:molybdopterin cofactor-binding domain-containing protein [Albitalea sp.]
MTRRRFLLSGLGAAGALVIGWGVLPPRSRVGSVDTLPQGDGGVNLNGWIKIAPDGSVLLAMNRSEMGQGVHTALAMLAAEELDVPLASVRLLDAGADKLYGNVAMFVDSLPFHPSEVEADTRTVRTVQWVVAKLARELGISVTGGSSSVADAWDVVRLAAATARAQLVGAASLQWRLPANEITIQAGVVSHASGPKAHFGELAKMASSTRASNVSLKDPKNWQLIGRAAPRIDLAGKVDGSARFGIDVRLPGQLFAVVRHCPMLGGSPGRVDVDAALKLPGVERVVRLGPYGGSTAALAVVGRSSWHAMEAARALQVDWQPAPGAAADSAAILADLARQAARAAAGQAGF